MIKARLLVLLPLFLLVPLGCQKTQKPGVLTGKVTYKGKDVTGGTVAFMTKDGGTVSTDMDETGNYTIPNVPVGEAKVTVDNKNLKAANPSGVRGGGGEHKMPIGKVPPGFENQKAKGTYMDLPAKYADVNKTTLKITVNGGPQTENFDLKD